MINSTLVVEIESLGAELWSIRKVHEEFEYMWQGSEWKKRSPILFPIVGAMIDDSYYYEGKRYSMPKHGFAQHEEFKVIEKSDTSVTFQLTDNARTRHYFPFSFVLELTYTLKGNTLSLHYKVENSDNKTLYFSLGAHPGFSCPLSGERELTGYQLKLNETEDALRYPVQGIFIAKEQVSGLQESDTITLSPTIFNHDALIFKNLRSHEVVLENCYNQRRVKVNFEGFEYIAFWAKPGAAFVCIEPWHGIADFVGHSQRIEAKEGIKTLEAKESFTQTLEIEIN